MQPEPKVNILIVDDRPENLLALETILDRLGEHLVQARSGEEALRCLLNQDFAVILLDVQMPGMNGFDTAALIRSRARSRQTPIIFLTAFSTSDDLMFKGYSLGAVDYLHKPIDPVVLTSKVSVFVELFKTNKMLQQQTEEVKRQSAQLKAINLELSQSEERFRLLSACSPVGIFVIDMDGRCTYVNPRCEAIYGLGLENHLETLWQQFVYPEDRDRVLSGWSAYLQGAPEYSDEFRLQMPDGAICWLHVRSSPLLADQRQLIGHVGTIEEITERKQVEAARNQVVREQIARREAEAASRMKDEFLAVLSHELRTPLNAMLGWARLLRTKTFDSATTTRALETIERNATTQAQLIEDILDVSKIIRGKLQLNYGSVNLTAIVEAAIDAVRPQAEAKSIQIETALDESVAPIWGDPVRLQQVVWNLLTNAIKFTPAQGMVEIWLTAVEDKPDFKYEAESAPVSHPYVQIQITDTGCGISPDFLPNVFDRFRQADSTTTRSHNGLGLGLAIVRHLVELHGGSVKANSEGEGKGSTFTVLLPKQAESLSRNSAAEAPQTNSVPNLNGVKILIVDDQPDAREFLSFALQQQGATIATAASTHEALTLLPKIAPDLLISDIGMPGKDGYELIRQIRDRETQTESPLPAIALTAYSRAEDNQQALLAGFQAHLPKPVEVADLTQAIARLLPVNSLTPSRLPGISFQQAQ